MKQALWFLAGLLLLPGLLFISGLAGLLPVRSNVAPPSVEASFGQHALSAGLKREAANLRSPTDAATDASLLAGMHLYRTDCAGCHGDSAAVSSWGATGFYPRVPQFAQRRIEISPEMAFLAIKHGVRYSGMGAWDGMLKDAEIWRAANFVSRIHSLPASVEREWRRPPRAQQGD